MNRFFSFGLLKKLQLAATGLILALALATGHASDPTGDYGDAPDDASHNFPTRYATTHSRAGGHGANHVITGLEVLGGTPADVTVEAGAEDPADPDGVPNLVDHDNHDDGLLGLTFRTLGIPFPGATGTQVQMQGAFQITIGPSAPAGERYLNVLVDTNRDQEWRDTAGGIEWVVVNQVIDTAPGATETLQVPLGVITAGAGVAADMWMRITLSRTPIDAAATIGSGGWDGSGDFIYGETEDYKIFDALAPDVPLIGPPPPPPFGCSCVFKLRAIPDPLVLFHTQVGKVTLHITIKGDPGCSARFDGMAVQNLGPMFGWGVVNGAMGVVGAPVPLVGAVFAGPGKYTIQVPITPTVHNIGAIQSFSIRFQISGHCAGGKIFAGTKTAGVLIIHPPAQICRFGLLSFGPASSLPSWTPLGIPPIDQQTPAPVSQVMFSSQMNTSGTITLAEVPLTPPGVPPDSPDTVQRYWLWSVSFEPDDLNLPENMPEIQTEIVALSLSGYSPLEIPQGITEANLHPIKAPVFSVDSFFDIFFAYSPDVGQVQPIDTIRHEALIMYPKGFSVWGLGGPQSPTVPVELSSFLAE